MKVSFQGTPGLIWHRKPSFLLVTSLVFAVVCGRAHAQTVFTWNSGDILTVLTPPILAGDTLNISTAANHDYNGTAIVNNGTVNWQDGSLRSGGGG